MTRVSGEAAGRLARCAVVFEAGDPPRTGRLAFWDPDGGGLPEDVGEPGELTVVVPEEDGGVASRTVPALRLPVADALPLVSRARRAPGAHPAAAFWGAVAVEALRLVAGGRLLPGVSSGDFDAWRVGPLAAEDVTRLRQLAAAMPATARAVPVAARGGEDFLLPDPQVVVRAFLDAVADGMTRTPAAAHAAGTAAFAVLAPQRVPHLRGWAEELAAGVDSGVRISLRLEIPGGIEAWEAGGASGVRAVVQAHSLADPALVADAGDLWGEAEHRFGPRARVDAVLAVRRAARVWPPLERLLDRAAPDELALDDDEVQDLLVDGAARLAAAGVEVRWPKELVRDLTARVVVGSDDRVAPSDLPSLLGGGELLRFDWQLALGGHPLTAAEMDRLAEASRPVVRLRDQWLLVDPSLVRKARERAMKPLTAIDALGVALTGSTEVDGEQVEVSATGWLSALRDRIAALQETGRPADERPPAALAATLRDYQLRGLRWLSTMTSLGLGGCLADDMGLGKTITLIALHLRRQESADTAGPTLVVCPASLLGNWEREIRRFAPGTTVRRFHGQGRSVEGVEDGFVLTTYGTMRLDAERLGTVHWGLLVADEAQHVKNARSGTARALRRIPAAARVALTGTPVENNLSELWAILDWTTPGLLGSLTAFRSRWAKPIEGGDEATARATAERLSKLVRPFLLRRRKSDPGIAPELPPKTETERPVALTPEQAGLYEAVVREIMAEVRTSTGMARRGQIVRLLTALKQICNHPAQYLKETRPRLAGRSGKLDLLDELVDTIVAEDGAVLVFTQYVSMARLLDRHLRGRGLPTLLLHGGTPVAAREEMVRRFQDGDGGEDGPAPIFLLSLKAAGTGLNLTRADHVIHYDRWWNPAVEEQATDRAYRIGQTRPVQVHKLVAEGTVEDRIAAMLRTKRELADAVLGRQEDGDEAVLTELTELSDAELATLVELRSAR
ncbi:Superfamily II DNA or RNA helicase, SNF2 family [Streptoalloteichus tenebrarius]|uniref:Superfamily II DNA or RNA helicase, SNF2 family n=1 Tax=Streptoalloteichus tenebrarius (strain ATCC 17920 / DSM 40477 / JCM 4838 / CBS 697.72 / NBRC 16177 / NCIMB 11028 / NRRL B-12390 / A12253. 1 / ISP 5477) TaxID=1933 RepID=A0ABT1HRZ3_STRSD|nr:DEAD/DEAH box helicase [Streptoalloteichus tenebrarius]MCP2258289.1 Superfamily II DNA or RNA helicase, SNF2 family [Streptoalloteichus tenebrarius]BFF04478.1 DEAD/DEAH box helicase [Streptoalloteichus tenebrarius]